MLVGIIIIWALLLSAFLVYISRRIP